MVSLLEKMGTAIESMEGDIRQMNNFLKDISLTQVDQRLNAAENCFKFTSPLPATNSSNHEPLSSLPKQNRELDLNIEDAYMSQMWEDPLGQAAELSQLGLISDEAYKKLEEQENYYLGQAQMMKTYDSMQAEEVAADQQKQFLLELNEEDLTFRND